MSDYVIDASSVLVFARDEPGAEIVTEIAREHRLRICSVNMIEVLSKLLDYQVPPERIADLLAPLALEEVPLTLELTPKVAALRAATRIVGLSLGDRCCLALAKALSLPVLTADRNWLDVADNVGVQVILTRPAARPQ